MKQNITNKLLLDFMKCIPVSPKKRKKMLLICKEMLDQYFKLLQFFMSYPATGKYCDLFFFTNQFVNTLR